MKGTKNRVMYPFSLDKITRHTANTRPFNELPHSVVTTEGHAGQNGKLPSTSCAQQNAKVQHSVHSHARGLLFLLFDLFSFHFIF